MQHDSFRVSNRDEERGVLPDGTDYVIRVPHDWNGVVIRDLDAVNRSENPELAPMYDDMLARGYALSGTMRHRLRLYQYDPRREIANLDRVLDRLESRFGRASHVIQYGCSGGGHVSLAASEDFHQRVAGAVALAAHTPVWLMNSFLDGWFALQVLIGPYYVSAGHGTAEDLPITGLKTMGRRTRQAMAEWAPFRKLGAKQRAPHSRVRADEPGSRWRSRWDNGRLGSTPARPSRT